MDIPVDRKKTLIQRAEQLARALGQFRTPNSGDAVDPSRLAEVFRYLNQSRSVKGLKVFLDVLPNSHHKKMSRGAEPQLVEVSKRVRTVVNEGYSTSELLYLLGQAHRLMRIQEKVGHGGGVQGGGGGGPRGRGGPRGGGRGQSRGGYGQPRGGYGRR